MNQEKIGAFIANRRKELNLTQKELAEKLGITDRQYLSGRMDAACLTCLFSGR